MPFTFLPLLLNINYFCSSGISLQFSSLNVILLWAHIPNLFKSSCFISLSLITFTDFSTTWNLH